MRILFNDLVQNSDAPKSLKTAILGDRWVGNTITINLGDTYTVNSIGIGFTDASQITVNGELVILDDYTTNGLYMIQEQEVDQLVIVTNGTFIGRFGSGFSHFVGISQSREPGFYTTNQSRRAEQGGVITGAGGYSGRKISVELSYKITLDIFRSFESAYPKQISRGFPLFILFDKEFGKDLSNPDKDRVPWERLYAQIDQEATFQSSVNRFLFSKKWSFVEAF